MSTDYPSSLGFGFTIGNVVLLKAKSTYNVNQHSLFPTRRIPLYTSGIKPGHGSTPFDQQVYCKNYYTHEEISSI